MKNEKEMKLWKTNVIKNQSDCQILIKKCNLEVRMHIYGTLPINDCNSCEGALAPPPGSPGALPAGRPSEIVFKIVVKIVVNVVVKIVFKIVIKIVV